MEAQWSPQWSLNGRHWSAKGGTMVVQGRQTCRSNWYIMFAFFTGRPMADHCASILRPRRCVCFPLPPLSDLWATDLLGDLCATVLNMLKTSRRPWRPWRCLNVLCATLERPGQPFGLPSAYNGDLASFVVAQGRDKGRSPCVKGVLGETPLGPSLRSRTTTRSEDNNQRNETENCTFKIASRFSGHQWINGLAPINVRPSFGKWACRPAAINS